MDWLLGVLGSSGFGAILGALGGLANRWMDFKTKTLEIEIRKLDHAHEKDMRVLDYHAMKMEVEGKVQVASIEGQAQVEAAGYSALSESLKHDAKIPGTPITNFLRAMVRPLITTVFLALICYINYRVALLLDTRPELLTDAAILEIIRWTLFQASVVLGWWFAMRPAGGAGLQIPTK